MKLSNIVSKIVFNSFVLIVLASCEGEHDKKIVKTSDGKFYKLDYRIGVVYALEEINVSQIDSLKRK